MLFKLSRYRVKYHATFWLAGYINVVIVSFAKPDCQYTKGSLTLSGTGLDFSSPGSVVKAGISALKAATGGNTKVLLAVGGATYYNWGAMNVQCVKDLVDDLGFDGEFICNLVV